MLSIAAAIRSAGSLEDNRAALQEIQSFQRQLDAIDREAAPMEDVDADKESDPAVDARYNELYEMAKECWRAIDAIVEQYDLTGNYIDPGPYQSNCVADAAFNY